MAGKGGGAWKVAYADFVTAMMAFFLVMWITSQNKAVKESIAQYFENPLGTNPQARATSVHGIEGASASAPMQGEQAGPHGSNKPGVGGETEPDPTGIAGGLPTRLRIFERLDRTRDLGTMVVFAEKSTELDEPAKLQLRALVPQLLGKPNKIQVRGHTHREMKVREGIPFDEWQLCYERCLVVLKFLVELGIEPERIRLSQDGSYEPYSERDEAMFRGMNSRVEVFAISEYARGFKDSVEERAGKFVEVKSIAQPPAGQDAKDADKDKGQAHGKEGGHGAKKADAHAPKKSGGH
jgi:chemotaxis protein MotB